jgi:hypothetical protein
MDDLFALHAVGSSALFAIEKLDSFVNTGQIVAVA